VGQEVVMPLHRLIQRSGVALTAVVVLLLGAGAPVRGQETSVQSLFERGALDQAIQRAESDRNPESTYLAAQAFAKQDNNDGARGQYSRLREGDAADWKAIGESGDALVGGDLDGARAAAARAVEANGGNPYAHYQAGLVANRQSRFQDAAASFGRASEIKPDLAYAHYYAGIASQRIKQMAKMSEHLETFVRLAPDAPERGTVQAILRTLRPRR
jgi:tetratricopeptide (TPR) repeat protein